MPFKTVDLAINPQIWSHCLSTFMTLFLAIVFSTWVQKRNKSLPIFLGAGVAVVVVVVAVVSQFSVVIVPGSGKTEATGREGAGVGGSGPTINMPDTAGSTGAGKSTQF